MKLCWWKKGQCHVNVLSIRELVLIFRNVLNIHSMLTWYVNLEWHNIFSIDYLNIMNNVIYSSKPVQIITTDFIWHLMQLRCAKLLFGHKLIRWRYGLHSRGIPRNLMFKNRSMNKPIFFIISSSISWKQMTGFEIKNGDGESFNMYTGNFLNESNSQWYNQSLWFAAIAFHHKLLKCNDVYSMSRTWNCITMTSWWGWWRLKSRAW